MKKKIAKPEPDYTYIYLESEKKMKTYPKDSKERKKIEKFLTELKPKLPKGFYGNQINQI